MLYLLTTYYRKLKANRTLINGSLFAIYSFINQGASFLLLIILAKYILPTDYGQLSLFNTVVMFLGYFMALSTSGYLSISYFKSDQKGFKKDVSAILVMAVITFVFFILVALLISCTEWFDLGFPPDLILYPVFLSFSTCIFSMLLDYLRVKEDVSQYGLYSISNATLNFVLSLLFVISLKQGWVGRVNAQMVCGFLTLVVALLFFKKESIYLFDYSWKRYKSIIYWGVPLIPHLASIWIRQGGDRYIINYYHSTYDVGLFSFALNLTSIIITIGMAFNSTNSVSIYKVLSDKEENSKWAILSRQSKQIFIIYILSTILVVLFVSLMIPILLPNYVESIPFFVILSIYGFLQCIYFLFCNYLFYYKETQTLMYITFVTSIIHLILSLVLTRYSLFLTCFVYVFIQSLVVFLVTRKALKLLTLHKIRG